MAARRASTDLRAPHPVASGTVPEPPAQRLVPTPSTGRTFEARRPVRVADLSRDGRLRFDAAARYLQDVSSDDTADAALEDDMAWVVRRTAIEVVRSARFRETLTLTTFCSATGSHWAERRVSVVGDRGAEVQASALWVHVDAATGRPRPLPQAFHDLYGEAAGGRRVTARFQHDPLVAAGATIVPWALRATDFDVLGHVNNAATWAVVEEVLAVHPTLRPPLRAELEHRLAIEPDDRVEVAAAERGDGSIAIWLREPGDRDAARLFATATVACVARPG
jgi:acyl-ACP thioesterase